MKKLLLITAAALVGITSQAIATLTITDVASSDLAIELRGFNKTDWASALSAGTFDAGGVTFTRDDTVDNDPMPFTPDTKLIVESIYQHAGFTNDFGVVMDTGLETVVTNLDTTASKRVTTDTEVLTILGFEADVGGTSTNGAGIVSTAVDTNVWTMAGGNGGTTNMLWFFEDIADGAIGNDGDYNDFIVLGTISAVPEPSTIISLIAVGFLGFVTWRNRRKATA